MDESRAPPSRYFSTSTCGDVIVILIFLMLCQIPVLEIRGVVLVRHRFAVAGVASGSISIAEALAFLLRGFELTVRI